MKRLCLSIVFAFLFASIAGATITERYVNDAGSGSADGTSEANAMSFTTFTDYMVTGGSFTAAPGDRFNIKGAITGRTTTADVWVNGGNATSPVVIRGYNSTIGDLTTLARTNGNGPLVTTNYPTISYTTGNLALTGSFILLEALQISGAQTGANSGVLILGTGTDNFIKRCYVFNSATNSNSVGIRQSSPRSGIVDCDVSLTGASGGLAAINVQTTSPRIIGCRINGNQSVGINIPIANCIATVALNTIYASTGNGIAVVSTSASCAGLYNTIVNGGADGINVVTGNTLSQIFIGNMLTDNTGNGLNMVSTSNAAFISNNRFRDNGTNIANGGDWITATGYGQVTSGNGTSDYVNAGGNNYNLIWTSPAVGAGNPLYADIGALQAPTPTSTPTNTPTPTATATATFTPCAPTPTATATATPTNTPTPTATATNTPTPTPTVTPTPCGGGSYPFGS